jgi:hypothetical protein
MDRFLAALVASVLAGNAVAFASAGNAGLAYALAVFALFGGITVLIPQK